MPQRRSPVIAYHLVWTAYGTWLPNDPRGSGSHFVSSPEIAALGEPHRGRKKIQPPRVLVRDFYAGAANRLQFEILSFNAPQITAIAEAFSDCAAKRNYTCYACAILPDHTHLVIRKHRDSAETMIEELQRASRERLLNDGLAPAPHPVWTLGGWKTFLSTPDRVRTVIAYVERNPTKSDQQPQAWPFVRKYDNWPFRGR